MKRKRFTEEQIARILKEAEGFGELDPRFTASLNSLATIYRAQGRYDEAEPLFKRTLIIQEKAFGSSLPPVAKSLNDLAT